jgi:hypothetical protein
VLPGVRILALIACCAWAYGWLCGCDDCAQEACDAAETPRAHAGIEQGVAGVIASRSDVCENECCACSWAREQLTVWHSDEPVNAGKGLRLVASGDPDAIIDVERSYAHALDPGEHMLCLHDLCAALHIERGDVFTVNVQLRYGPPSLIVYGPDDREPRDDLVFSVNKE